MPKVLKLIHSCKECPHRTYGSAGQHYCAEASQELPIGKENSIPSWCPLPDHPASRMAALELQVNTLSNALNNKTG